MKKIILALSILFWSSLSFAAVAEVQRKTDTFANGNGTWTHIYDVAFYGTDISIPGDNGNAQLDFGSVQIVTSTSTALASIPGLIATAVRALATSRGYTVPANKVILPSYQAQ